MKQLQLNVMKAKELVQNVHLASIQGASVEDEENYNLGLEPGLEQGNCQHLCLLSEVTKALKHLTMVKIL